MPEIQAEIVGQNGAVSGPSEGSMPDFSALKAQAMSMMPDTPETPVVPEAPKVENNPLETRVPGASDKVEANVATPATPEAEPVTEVATQTEKQLANLADDALVSVPVDGEDVVMSWKDAKAGFSRHSKFTKNMQQLAAERQQIDAAKAETDQLRAERGAMQNFLRNKDLIAQYVAKQFGQAQAQAAPQATDPNQIATYGDAQQIAAQQAEQFQAQLRQTEQAMQERIDYATAKIVHAEQTAKHATVITSTISDIFTANPVLKTIPNMEDNIRFEVARMNPQTEAEAVDFFKSVAAGVMDNLSSHFKASEKIQKVAAVKAKLDTKTIEPAAGTAPSVQPTSYKDSNGVVDWKKVKDIAMNFNS